MKYERNIFTKIFLNECTLVKRNFYEWINFKMLGLSLFKLHREAHLHNVYLQNRQTKCNYRKYTLLDKSQDHLGKMQKT